MHLSSSIEAKATRKRASFPQTFLSQIYFLARGQYIVNKFSLDKFSFTSFVARVRFVC